jgi:hypothetical protein
MTRAASLLALLCAGCGAQDPSCANDLPAACPATPPSYQAQIDPIFVASCRTCHAPGGQESGVELVSYQEIYGRRSSVLDQVYGCRMPPAGGPALSAADRSALLAWLVCGAPDN